MPNVNNWIGSKWGKSNETKRWEHNIASALVKLIIGAPMGKNSIQATMQAFLPLNLSQTQWSTLVSKGTTKISRRKPRKGYTEIILTFEKI
jgi:hypothetical protein